MGGSIEGVQRGPRVVGAWALATIAVDQAAKWAVARWVSPGDSVELVGGLVRLTHVTNSGAAFGLFEGHRALFVVATGVVVALAAALAVWFDAGRRWALVGLGLAAGGASGNLVDRLQRGAVLDFIDVAVWPVFNLADTAIVLGVAMLLWHLMREAPRAMSAESDGHSR